jgi:hypothetical protein
MSTPGPAYITVEDFDDTELGAAVRAAYADGHGVVQFIAPVRRCETCERPLTAQETCLACGDPDEDPEPRDLSL